MLFYRPALVEIGGLRPKALDKLGGGVGAAIGPSLGIGQLDDDEKRGQTPIFYS